MWQVNELFENREYYLRRFNKKQYLETFEEYEKAFHSFDALCRKHYEEHGDIELLCGEVAQAVCLYVSECASGQLFKNARQEAEWQEQMNLFVVTYLFPAILECRNDYYKQLVKALEKQWAQTFKGYKIKAATFETINSGFQKKAFGLF
ncbi:MAG: hypothetical protein E7289_02450 [Lachnospiraceae bacterium]|nr:hypothetical protein [Lachnospiraceae bacterium]